METRSRDRTPLGLVFAHDATIRALAGLRLAKTVSVSTLKLFQEPLSDQRWEIDDLQQARVAPLWSGKKSSFLKPPSCHSNHPLKIEDINRYLLPNCLGCRVTAASLALSFGPALPSAEPSRDQMSHAAKMRTTKGDRLCDRQTSMARISLFRAVLHLRDL